MDWILTREAVITLAMDDAAEPVSLAPVVTLRRNRTGQGADDASIYRYDRPALIEAMAERVARHGAGAGAR